MKQTRPAFLSYAIALLSVVLATALRLLLTPILGDQAPLVTYVIAVALIAWYAGLGPALVATVLGALAAHYFILPSREAYLIFDQSDVTRFLPYLVLCSIISLISEAMRRTRARAEENVLAFAESRNLLLTTLASIGDAVITTDERGCVTFINPVAETLTGWAEKDARDKPLEEVFNIIHEQTRAKVENPLTKALTSGVAVGLANHTILIKKDGSEIPIDESSAPIKDEQGKRVGVVLVFRDIAERLRAAKAQVFLAEASNALASSLDYETTVASIVGLSVPYLADWCMIHILNENGQIKPLAAAHVDPAKAEEAKELDNRYPQDPNARLGPPNVLRTGKSELYPQIQDSLLVEYASDEKHLNSLRRRGMKSAMVVPMLARNRTLGAISFIIAETERQYTEADLALAEDLAHRAAFAVDNALLYRDAQNASERAEQANRLKDEFLATVSHELRTPLNAIIGWAHLLRAKRFDETTSARAMETIERNAKAQARIIEDILDVSRAITGKLRLEVQPVMLAPVIESALDAVRPAAEAKEIRLQPILDPRAGPVSGDPNRLQQIVWNILSNAVKFTPKGGRVMVRLERVNSHVEIVVSDTGQGIHADLLPFIFDRFRQGDSTTTRQHGGLGLGLAIVRHLVELHGGTVHADSPGYGGGASFTVNLPLIAIFSEHRSPGLAYNAGPILPPIQDMPQLFGIKVMVVDDEPDTCEVLKVMIEQYGGNVRTCASSAEALETLKSWKPDVLVSDIEMPGEDGYRLIEKIRSLAPEQGGTIPALALTAYARVADRMRALSAGYQMHLAKPAEPVELTVVIASLAIRDGKGFIG